MNSGFRHHLLWFVLLGCVSIGIYFYLVAKLPINKLLFQQVSRNEILAIANEAYGKSEIADYDLRQKMQMHLNTNLMTYVQTKLNNQLPDAFYPVGYWQIEWSGKVETKKQEPQSVRFNVEYDFNGNLIRLEQEAPDLNLPPNYKEEAALSKAKSFLHDQRVDTTQIALTNKIINKDDRVLQYDFSFSKSSPIAPELKESYTIQISGRNIVSYQARVTFDDEQQIVPKIYKTSEYVSLMAAIAIWLTISLFMVVHFLKKFRTNELEFKRAFWTGVFGFVLMWGIIAIGAWPDWTAILIGGSISSVFTGLGILITYSVTDSLHREVWPEKLELLDILYQGYFRVKELGQAVLKSILLSGLTLLAFGLLFMLVTKLQIGYLEFGKDMLWIFQGNVAGPAAILEEIVVNLFIAIMLFSFWVTYLKTKIVNPKILLAAVALSINFAGLNLFNIHPTFLSFLLFLPVALIWARCAIKEDIITLLLSLIIVKILLEFIFINHLPNPFLSAPGIFTFFYFLVLLICGFYFVLSKRSVKEFDLYIPEYVGRIAERERFLKELEIARSVQMRFLPQTIPSVPKLEIACICKPAMEVGGDYYDFIQNSDHSLGVVIGDVSGKGVSAAFYMTMAKGILKTLAKTTNNPKQILSEMNTIFYENVPQNVFISIMYGTFDLEHRSLKFARAGHNPLIVYKNSTRKPELILPRGLAIGLDKGAIFTGTIEEIDIPIEKDDIFVFYTDGISESTNKNGDEFGESRLQKIISDNQSSSAQDLLKKITDGVTHFAGSAKQHDDLTMVIVKVADMSE